MNLNIEIIILNMEKEPLATIKVIFDELPDDIKHHTHLLISTGITCLILTNIMLISQLLYFYVSKVRSRSIPNNIEWL